MGSEALHALLKSRTSHRASLLPHEESLAFYSLVYQSAAKHLHDVWGNNGSVWALPVVFLYRHAIELAMKALLTESNTKTVAQLSGSHSIQTILPDVDGIACILGSPLSQQLKDIIREWDQSDRDGSVSRFPANAKGTSQIILNAEQFHLDRLVSDAEAVLNELTLLIDRV